MLDCFFSSLCVLQVFQISHLLFFFFIRNSASLWDVVSGQYLTGEKLVILKSLAPLTNFHFLPLPASCPHFLKLCSPLYFRSSLPSPSLSPPLPPSCPPIPCGSAILRIFLAHCPLPLPLSPSPPSPPLPLSPSPPSPHAQLFLVFGVCVQLVCQWVLRRLAAPHLGPQGELLDAGADLSDNYIAE